MSDYESYSTTEGDPDEEMTDDEYAVSYGRVDSITEGEDDQCAEVSQYSAIHQNNVAQNAANAAYYMSNTNYYSPSQSSTSVEAPQDVWKKSTSASVSQNEDSVVHMQPNSNLPPEEHTSHDPERIWKYSRCAALSRSVVSVCGETCGGVCELGKMVGGALSEAIFNSSFYPRKLDMGGSSAVGGRLLFLILVQVILLTIQISVVIIVGSGNEFARLVHVDFLKFQCISLVSVPLGVYIYMFGGLSPASPGAARVYTLYTVCEFMRMMGDLVNLIRFSRAFDDYKHIISAIAPELVPPDDDWDHGVCGRPHAVGIVLITACVVGLLCSLSNILSLLIQRGVVHSRTEGKTSSDPEQCNQKNHPSVIPSNGNVFRNSEIRLRSQRSKPPQDQRDQAQSAATYYSNGSYSSPQQQDDKILMDMVFGSAHSEHE